jgi:hypothetical protein
MPEHLPPLPPEHLVGAKQDRVDVNVGKVRPGRSGRVSESEIVYKFMERQIAARNCAIAAKDAEIERLKAEVERLHATIQPVRDWYDADGECTDVAKMLTDAIADLQKDRAKTLTLKARVRELEEALRAWDTFWDDMPKGQLGKLVLNVGLLNDAFIKMHRVLNGEAR